MRKKARDNRLKQVEHDQGELIEIDKEYLNQLMKTPQLSKGKHSNDLYLNCNSWRRGRISSQKLKIKNFKDQNLRSII